MVTDRRDRRAEGRERLERVGVKKGWEGKGGVGERREGRGRC